MGADPLMGVGTNYAVRHFLGTTFDRYVKGSDMRLLILMLCVVVCPSVAYTAPITYTFGTHLSIVHSGLAPSVVMGSLMTWSFTIDSEDPDQLPLDPIAGSYALGNSFWTAGSLSGTSTGGFILFTNQPAFVGDSISVDVSGMTFSSSGGFTPTGIHLILQSPSGIAFDSTLPPTSLDVSLFTVTGMGMAFEGFPLLENRLSVLGPVETATATPGTVVPEPASLLLFTTGGLGLIARATTRGWRNDS